MTAVYQLSRSALPLPAAGRPTETVPACLGHAIVARGLARAGILILRSRMRVEVVMIANMAVSAGAMNRMYQRGRCFIVSLSLLLPVDRQSDQDGVVTISLRLQHCWHACNADEDGRNYWCQQLDEVTIDFVEESDIRGSA